MTEYPLRGIGLNPSCDSGHDNDNDNRWRASSCTWSASRDAQYASTPAAGSPCQFGASGAAARRNKPCSDGHALQVGPDRAAFPRSGQRGQRRGKCRRSEGIDGTEMGILGLLHHRPTDEARTKMNRRDNVLRQGLCVIRVYCIHKMSCMIPVARGERKTESRR
jgi:hypothetical protein